jgi:hypothetical protein
MREFQDMAEEEPDAFIRYKYQLLLIEARGNIASLLNAPLASVVFFT